YHNVSHPSLPNYLGLTSGVVGGSAEASTCTPAECPQKQPNLFDQVSASGHTWGQYAQSMQGNCNPVKDSQYEPEHAVPVYYADLASTCQRWDVPLGDPAGGALRAELDRGSLPTFTFITPDGDHESGAGGDRWLGDWISLIAATPDYQAGNTAIFVVWDEGGGSDDTHAESCANAAHADVHAYPSCWVAALIVSPSTRPGTRSAAYFNHFSLLRTTEDLLGLDAHLGQAADARSTSMRSAFNL
ncbi:MAG: alkaline phosphatase family protein, partial [Candidatus Dormibacteria bacterium]